MALYPIFFRALKTIIMPSFMLLTESEQFKHISALLLVEIKKVTSKDGESREDTLCRLGIYKRNKEKIVLNTNHNYSVAKYRQSHFVVSDGVWLNHELDEFNDYF